MSTLPASPLSTPKGSPNRAESDRIGRKAQKRPRNDRVVSGAFFFLVNSLIFPCKAILGLFILHIFVYTMYYLTWVVRPFRRDRHDKKQCP